MRNNPCVYFPPGLGLLPRLDKLVQKTHVSRNRLIVAAVMACIDILEKELPKRRTIKINNVTLIP